MIGGEFMQEMLNRDLSVGDLVLHDMSYALVIGDNKILLYCTHIVESCMIRTYHPVYLITNLQPQEVIMRNKLLVAYNKIASEEVKRKTEKKQQKSVARRACKRGSIVRIGNYSCYLYLGKARYVDLDGQEYSGHIYTYMQNAHMAFNLETNDWISQRSGAVLDGNNPNSFKKLVGNYEGCLCYSEVLTIHEVQSQQHNNIKVLKNMSGSTTSVVGEYKISGNVVKVPLRQRNDDFVFDIELL